MGIQILHAFADNYIYLLLNRAASDAAVVDPGDAKPVLDFLHREALRLSAILITHHHSDHTGGIRLLTQRFPGVPVYGGAGDHGRITGQNHFLREGDEVCLAGRSGKILDVPGHTRAHIAYFFPSADGEGDLFSGDTVFGGTIGNLFEGTPEVMFESIQKVRRLPLRTRIWCSHEYTLQYVREAVGLDPGNERAAGRLKSLLAAVGRPTVPLTLGEECATNPFFRWDDPVLAARFHTAPGLATFRHLCEIT